MKKFLTVLTSAALGAALVTSAFAQGAGPKGGGAVGQAPKGGQQRGGMMMRGGGMKMQEEVFAKLNLSAAQKTKIEALQKELQKKMQTMIPKEGQKVDREKIRAQMKPVMDKYQKDFKAILTAEQFKKYEQLMKEAREKMMKERGNRPGGGAPRSGAGSKPPL